MARTSIADVKVVIATSLTDEDITSFINIANRIVTQVVGTSTALSDDIKEDIETFLTAHLIAISREPQNSFSRSRVGNSEIYVSSQFGKGLEATSFGQTVKLLDTTGAFTQLGKIKASLKSYGPKTVYDSDIENDA